MQRSRAIASNKGAGKTITEELHARHRKTRSQCKEQTNPNEPALVPEVAAAPFSVVAGVAEPSAAVVLAAPAAPADADELEEPSAEPAVDEAPLRRNKSRQVSIDQDKRRLRTSNEEKRLNITLLRSARTHACGVTSGGNATSSDY